MIGNDVIDILQSRNESNWRRKGFLQKLFTPSEQLLISETSDPETMVWLLWSMKEAAYKIHNRQTKIREYIPKKLMCTIISKKETWSTGHVICGENVYHTKSVITPEHIHTIAVVCFNQLDDVIEIEKKDIFKDPNGIPYLSNSTLKIAKDVSVSHHGRFEKVVTIKVLSEFALKPELTKSL